MKIPDAQPSGPSASQVKTEDTSENVEGAPHAPEPAADRDFQMEYSSD
jgi:hypothetical protein